MPLTALFPEDHEKITINQGSIGDCYLLATLDCVANVGTEGRERLKSLFTQTKEGVTVRIPRSQISENLKLKMLEKRYKYSYDQKNKQDVFFINNALLDEIDAATSIGATTNSLAVKILEHLSSYYFVRSWTRHEAITSLTAHSLSENIHGMGSTLFVSHLINVETSKLDIDKVIKLKSIYPNFPVYVSMSWGENHEGVTHERHALRVERVTKTSSDHQFALVNPWHNTTIDAPLSKSVIAGKDPSFSIFTMYSHAMKFKTKIILELPEDDAKLVASTPDLSNFLKKLQMQQPQFGKSESMRAIALYKVMPQISSIYAKLKREERLKFNDCVYQANGNKEVFVSKYLSKMHGIEAVRELIREEVPANIIQEIVALCINTKDQELFKLLNTHRIDVLRQLLFSTMNKDLFLQNLIELEKTQTVPNLIRLKNIDAYITAYNVANPSKILTAEVDKSLIAAVSLTSTETAILEAQVIVEQSLDAVKNQELSFNEVTNAKALEDRKNTLLAQVKNLESGQTEAFLKLGDKDKEKVNLIFQKKIEEIASEATKHTKLLKTAEESIARFVGQFDLPISFANDFTEESIQLHARILMTQIKTLSRSKNLQAAQSTLGFKIHPAIDQAIKEKTAEISTLVQARLNSLNQAMLIIERTAKTIAEFPVLIPDLHSVTAFQEEQAKQVKLVQALMAEPTVLEAHRQLGIQGQHPLLTAAFNTKQQIIDQAIQSKLTIIVDANKKVQTYHASIRGVTSDFSKAATEKDVMTVFLTFIKEMDRIRAVIDADIGLAVIPSAKTDLLAAWQTHQQFAQEANIVAHNRVIYTQIQTALDKSGFVFSLNQIGQRAEATKTMVSMGHAKFAPYEKPSLALFTAVTKVRDELLARPKEGKISTVQAKEKIDAFQRKILAAITSAGKVLNLSGDWQTRLSSLQESATQVKTNFTVPSPQPNPHGFYSSKSKLTAGASRKELHQPLITGIAQMDTRSLSRMVVVAA